MYFTTICLKANTGNMRFRTMTTTATTTDMKRAVASVVDGNEQNKQIREESRSCFQLLSTVQVETHSNDDDDDAFIRSEESRLGRFLLEMKRNDAVNKTLALCVFVDVRVCVCIDSLNS